LLVAGAELLQRLRHSIHCIQMTCGYARGGSGPCLTLQRRERRSMKAPPATVVGFAVASSWAAMAGEPAVASTNRDLEWLLVICSRRTASRSGYIPELTGGSP